MRRIRIRMFRCWIVLPTVLMGGSKIWQGRTNRQNTSRDCRWGEWISSTLSTLNTTTEVPLSKAPNPQLLPGRCSINGSPLLRVCVRCVCVCVCLFTAACVHLGWVNCRAQIPSLGHHTWPHVTSLSIKEALIKRYNFSPPKMFHYGASYPCTMSPECAATVITGDWGLVALTGVTTVGSTAVEVVTIGLDCNTNRHVWNPSGWICVQ